MGGAKPTPLSSREVPLLSALNTRCGLKKGFYCLKVFENHREEKKIEPERLKKLADRYPADQGECSGPWENL